MNAAQLWFFVGVPILLAIFALLVLGTNNDPRIRMAGALAWFVLLAVAILNLAWLDRAGAMKRPDTGTPLTSGAERPAHQRAAEPAADRPHYDALRSWLDHCRRCPVCSKREMVFCEEGAAMVNAAAPWFEAEVARRLEP